MVSEHASDGLLGVYEQPGRQSLSPTNFNHAYMAEKPLTESSRTRPFTLDQQDLGMNQEACRERQERRRAPNAGTGELTGILSGANLVCFLGPGWLTLSTPARPANDCAGPGSHQQRCRTRDDQLPASMGSVPLQATRRCPALQVNRSLRS